MSKAFGKERRGFYFILCLCPSVFSSISPNSSASVHLWNKFHSSLHLYEGSYAASAVAKQSCYPWISSSAFIRLQSRCDISYLLCCLFIPAISFPPLLILFHSLPSPTNSFSPLPSLATSRNCLILPLSFTHLLYFWLFFFFYTAAPHPPLVAAASLLKVQNWMILFVLGWATPSWWLCRQGWYKKPHT